MKFEEYSVNKGERSIDLAVLFGGRSSEHEISIITGLQTIAALDSTRYKIIPVYIHPNGKWYTGEILLDKQIYHRFSEIVDDVQEVTLYPDPTVGGLKTVPEGRVLPIDVYFLAFHGQYGEDGSVQGLLELADACYTGSGVLGSAVAMNKFVCKQLVKANGIPTVPGCIVCRHDASKNLKEAKEKIWLTPGLGGFPLFIKPCHLGSSIGISRVDDEASLEIALAKVFRYDTEALVEPCLEDLLEVNVSVLEGDPPIASVLEVPVASGKSLTYEDKYMRGGNKGVGDQGMASLTRVIDPQDLDINIKRQVIEYALKAFEVLKCAGVVRFDFMIDTRTDALYFNELNPLPGSFAFYLWEKSRPLLLYTRLLDHVIQWAQKRKAENCSVEKFIGFKALRPLSVEIVETF